LSAHFAWVLTPHLLLCDNRSSSVETRWIDGPDQMLEEIELQDCVVDLRLGELVRAGSTLRLTTQELDLLRYFCERPGELITREQLLHDVWGYSRAAVTRAVQTAIKRLRKKIEVDPANPRHLLTVYGSGYRFERRTAPRKRPVERDARAPHDLVFGSGPSDDFVGRESELDTLVQLVQSGVRLLTLLGPGGTGKTRLAREFLRHWDDVSQSTHRLWFVDCTEALDLPMLIHCLRTALGLAPAAELSQREQMDRIGVWLGLGQPALIVIDNLEQVSGAARSLIESLLAAGPNLQLLATSRHRLKVKNERVIELKSLDRESAIKLFESRARTAHIGHINHLRLPGLWVSAAHPARAG